MKKRRFEVSVPSHQYDVYEVWAASKKEVLELIECGSSELSQLWSVPCSPGTTTPIIKTSEEYMSEVTTDQYFVLRLTLTPSQYNEIKAAKKIKNKEEMKRLLQGAAGGWMLDALATEEE